MSDQDKDKKGFSFFDESTDESSSDESFSKDLGEEDLNKVAGGAGPVCMKCNKPVANCECINYT